LLKQVDRETALRVLDTLWRYKMETMPEQAEQSRNDWLALISRLKNTDADTAKGDRPVQAWHGVDWPSLIAEMNEMKSLSPHPRGFRFEAWRRTFIILYFCSSFRNTGEQIDGSFRLNDDFYLLRKLSGIRTERQRRNLHVFEGKLSTKAKWARGVFISWMGFTDEGLTAFVKEKTGDLCQWL
jgi:hypothetical protein